MMDMSNRTSKAWLRSWIIFIVSFIAMFFSNIIYRYKLHPLLDGLFGLFVLITAVLTPVTFVLGIIFTIISAIKDSRYKNKYLILSFIFLVLSVILCFGLFQIVMADMRDTYNSLTIEKNEDGEFYIDELGLYINERDHEELPEILLFLSVYISMIFDGMKWLGLLLIVGFVVLAVIAYNTFFLVLVLPFKGIDAAAKEKRIREKEHIEELRQQNKQIKIAEEQPRKDEVDMGRWLEEIADMERQLEEMLHHNEKNKNITEVTNMADGDLQAQFELAITLLQNGDPKGLDLLNEVAKKGHQKAGEIIENTKGHKSEDNINVVLLTKEKALNGDKNSQLQMGLYCEFGEMGLSIDFKEAVYWYTMAANPPNPHPYAQFSLAVYYHNCYQNDNGTVQDAKEALYWYRQAIENRLTGNELDIAQNSITAIIEKMN